MKRRYQVLSLLLAAFLIFGTGCGNQSQTQQGEMDSNTQETVESGQNESENMGQEQEDPVQEETIIRDDVGKKNVESFTFTEKEKFNYGDWEMEVLGFEEKKKVSSEVYTDEPADGKVYLILYLKIHNRGEKEHYFAPDNLETLIDGEGVETTYLVNTPHEYESLFRNYEPDELSAGFLVWEVPKGWKKFEMTYHGLEVDRFVTSVLKLNRKSLSKPKDYDPLYLT